MRFSYEPVTMQAFGGRIDANGSMGFDDDRAFSLDVTVSDVRLQEMLRPVPGEEPKLAGTLGLTLEAEGAGPEPSNTLTGSGKLTIAEGHLISVPLVGAFAAVLKLPGQQSGQSDRGEIDFTLLTDRARIDKSIIESPSAAARGTGHVYYDGRLDLQINAGVIEKAQSLLGGLGDLLAGITDRLLPYQVSGTWSEPVIKPAPLGIGLGREPDEDR
jgi:hypothetical protein